MTTKKRTIDWERSRPCRILCADEIGLALETIRGVILFAVRLLNILDEFGSIENLGIVQNGRFFAVGVQIGFGLSITFQRERNFTDDLHVNIIPQRRQSFATKPVGIQLIEIVELFRFRCRKSFADPREIDFTDSTAIVSNLDGFETSLFDVNVNRSCSSIETVLQKSFDHCTRSNEDLSGSNAINHRIGFRLIRVDLCHRKTRFDRSGHAKNFVLTFPML